MFIMETSHPSQPFSRIGDHLCEKKYCVFSMKQMICVETDHLVCMECSESRRLTCVQAVYLGGNNKK